MSDPKKNDKQEKQPEVQPQLQQHNLSQQEVINIAGAVSESTLKAILPTLLASLKQGQPPPPNGTPGRRHRSLSTRQRCTECGFFVADGKETCDEHVMMVVYPTSNPEFGDWFVSHGIRISGVKFASEHENHRIPVPKQAASTILERLQAWEQHEREMRNGKDKRRRGPSARVSPNGVTSNPVGADTPIGWQ